MTLIVLVIVGLGVWLFIAYNKLRALAENVKRRQANVAASVKKRHDIAQRLADIAASYGDHEKLTHFTVVEGETNVMQANAAAADASRVIGNVQLLANRFPELKANVTYQQLMRQLDEIENSVLERREAYNAAAETYNATRGSLPHLFYADALGFAEAPYFTVDEDGTERLAEFRTDDGRILRDTVGRMATVAGTHAQTAAGRLKAANERHRATTAEMNEAPNGGSIASDRPATPPQREDGSHAST